jgi:tetratricopeptide (TPR) repeat protein
VVLFQLRRFDDAARQFEEALRIDPNYSNASENLKKARQLAPLPPTPPKP